MEDDDERWEKFVEHNRKLQKIHEEFVREKSNREILAEKRMIKQGISSQRLYDQQGLSNQYIFDQQAIPYDMESASYFEETTDNLHGTSYIDYTSGFDIQYDLDNVGYSSETTENLQGTTNIDYTSGPDVSISISTDLTGQHLFDNQDVSSKLEADKTIARERYRKRRYSETLEQREARNMKRRQKYMEKRISETAEDRDERNKKRRDNETKQDVIVENGLDLLETIAGQLRDKRNLQRREKYKQRKLHSGIQVETVEQREERNKKRRRNYQKGIKDETIEKRKKCNEERRRRYQNRNVTPNLECDASKLIVRPLLKFTALPSLSKRMKTKIKNIKEKFALSNTILDIGSADKICSDCGALMWRFEQTEKQQRLNSNKFSLCCGNGKVRLPLLRETPRELKSLLYGADDKSKTFRKSIRMYNNAFAFTSVGANVDKEVNNGSGPYVYRIFGEIYHQIGSLRPEDSKKAVFSQIYMYDGQQQLEERLNFPNGDDKLDTEITESLSAMMDRENALVDIYRDVRERFKDFDIVPAQLRLVANRETDGRESNTPTNAHEFAALVANDDLSQNRDILVHTRGGKLHRISVLHPCFMSLQYPFLFPYGEDGYRIDILHAGVSSKSENERDSLSIREYYCFRVQYRDREGHTLIAGGRLFLQFLVDAWACIEHTRLGWVLLNQTILRSDLYNNIVDSVNRGDTDASTIGKRIILPSSYTGSPRYMQQNYQDCMAVCRRLGSPDLFITFTCNPKWPEIKEYCDKIPHSTPADRPDICARVFKIKLDLLLEDLTNKHVLGKVI